MSTESYPIILRSSRINVNVAFESNSKTAARRVIQEVKEMLHFLMVGTVFQ